MTILVREFFRSPRGPSPTDEDSWRLAFDEETKRLFVRHHWSTKRDSGNRDFTVEELLAQGGAASEALIALLFDGARARRQLA
jgi:hypothetical protein